MIPSALIKKVIQDTSTKSAKKEFINLYRAVSHSEWADIQASRVFRAGPNSYETGKFFAESGKDAIKWGRAMEGTGNFRVIQAQFPKSIAEQFKRWEKLDGIGPARFGTFEQMGTPQIRLWPGSP